MSVLGEGRTHFSNVLQMSVVSTSLSFGLRSLGSLSLDINALFRGEIFRIIASHLYFKTWPQLLLGLIVIRNLSSFELYMGTRKFGNFMFLNWGISTLAQIAVVAVAGSVGIRIIPEPGPFFYIFSLLPFYHSYIPKVSPNQYKLLGVTLSEKTWIYGLCLQLCFSDGLGSITSALCGLVAGKLYLWDDSRLQRFRLPAVVERVLGVVGHFLDSIFSAPANRNPQRRAGPAERNEGGPLIDPAIANAYYRQANVMGGAVEPSAENINSLMNLGFERAQCISALRSTNNNVEAAADRLFSTAR